MKDADDKLYAKTGNDPAIVIKNGAMEIKEGIFPGWQLRGVEVVEGENQAIWQLNDSLQRWTLDSNWKRLTSSSLFGLNSSDAFTTETNFQQDFNNDGIIGIIGT